MRVSRAAAEVERTDQLPASTRALDRWRLLRLILGVQGCFSLLLGLWPLLHPRSFAWLVGERRDLFQLDATSALLAVVGAVLLLAAALRPRPDGLLVTLGAASNLALALMDWRHAGDIRAIYWLDFAVRLLFAIALLVVYLAARWHDRRRDVRA